MTTYNSQLTTHNSTGFTLVDILIGSALMVIVFVGFFGAFQGLLKVLAQSQHRVTALALANQKIEMARNLSYGDVGTEGGIPAGTIPETETVTRNSIDYCVKTTVVYVDDPFDGIAPADLSPNDFKRLKVKVSWSGRFGGNTVLITDRAPENIEGGGGTIFISVFNAEGKGISQANIHIINDDVSPSIDANYQTNADGILVLPGAPPSIGNYKISVAKTGYSSDRTYGSEEVANPSKPHATVFEGELTEISFSIDKLSNFSVDTKTMPDREKWEDSFADGSNISDSNNIDVNGGEVKLAMSGGDYQSPGFVVSVTISPATLVGWHQFSFNDDESSDTDIKYQFLYFDSSNWVLIPDDDLTIEGTLNSAGFDDSPLDISGLDKDEYPEIRLKANLETFDVSLTPTLYDWKVLWNTTNPQKLADIKFYLQGGKIIGTNLDEDPIYKYSKDHITDSNGHINISGIEWDSYTFSINKEETGFDLMETDPSPQPVNLSPEDSISVVLYLKAENSLFVVVKDSSGGDFIFGASVRVYNLALGYDSTLSTNEDGETFFMPMEADTYNLEVTADGYQDYNGSVDVSGDMTEAVILNPSP